VEEIGAPLDQSAKLVAFIGRQLALPDRLEEVAEIARSASLLVFEKAVPVSLKRRRSFTKTKRRSPVRWACNPRLCGSA
jgi:hypothetical protein